MGNHWQNVLNLHLDPKWGSPYWIDLARRRGVRPDDVRDMNDLALFGVWDDEVLRNRPTTDFVPRKLIMEQTRLIRAETGSTTGRPKRTVFTEEEFRRGFIDPWCRTALRMGMERGLEWLYIGPGAPHIIGIAAREYCRGLRSNDPFCVGVDARWIKKFLPHTMGFKSYLRHIISQALDILETQTISALFTTPPVLEALAGEMREERRKRIRAIHVGGMRIGGDLLARLRESVFPNAAILPGYGNSLFGVAPAAGMEEGHIDYYPDGKRLIFHLLPMDAGVTDDVRISLSVNEGGTGQLMVHRFDESLMIVNALERDQGTLVPPSRLSRSLAFADNGLRDPRPLQQFADVAAAGVY